MEFEKQKPVSEEFREGWENTFSPNESSIWRGAGIFTSDGELQMVEGIYPNGCPILPNSVEGDGVREGESFISIPMRVVRSSEDH